MQRLFAFIREVPLFSICMWVCGMRHQLPILREHSLNCRLPRRTFDGNFFLPFVLFFRAGLCVCIFEVKLCARNCLLSRCVFNAFLQSFPAVYCPNLLFLVALLLILIKYSTVGFSLSHVFIFCLSQNFSCRFVRPHSSFHPQQKTDWTDGSFFVEHK